MEIKVIIELLLWPINYYDKILLIKIYNKYYYIYFCTTFVVTLLIFVVELIFSR